jgi:hypothetical protein
MKPGFIAIVSLLSVAAVGPCAAQQKHATGKQPVKQEQPAIEVPPPTLAQMPATPPQVSYQNGQLTISAENSTLGDILKAVRTQTGATIDIPGNPSERVVGHFGPAPARDVLTALLNGSHFNYLLLGSASNPTALDRVILMAKSASSSSGNSSQPPVEQAAAYNQNGFARPAPAMAAPGGNTVVVDGQDAQDGDSQDDATDDSADATDDSQADDQTDQTDQGQGDDQQAADDQQQQQQPDGQPAVKTPEQLLQELQQRQQQIQQGIQPGGGQQGFPNPGGVPGPPGIAAPPHN